MTETIKENKFVELKYEVLDKKTGHRLSYVDFPLGYVHGVNSVMSSAVTDELEGKSAGDVIEVEIDCNAIYGPRDESLVFTDKIENVPEEYRELGTTIHMENEKGERHSFIVTRIDDETLTVDGNNPLSERDAIFKLEVVSVRDATEDEIEAGGAIVEEPDVLKSHNAVPIN